MGLQIKVDGTDRSSAYSLAEMSAIQIAMAAYDGEVAIGSAPIPVATAFETYAGQQFEAIDTYSGSLTILDGFTGSHVRERGADAARRLSMVHTISDDNALLYGFRAVKWSRPKESTRARFLAFLDDFVPSVTDTTWVTTTKTAIMPRKVYTTETLFAELQQEISDLTGNTIFIEHRRAHCHQFTEGIIGGLAISDTTFDFATSFPPLSASVSRSKDPMDLGNDIKVKSPSGVATKTDSTSISRHDSAGLKHQRYVEVAGGSAATQAAEILASSKEERITYECDIGPLTAAQIDSIPVGCLVNVTSAVMGLSSSTQRIARMALSYRTDPAGRSWLAHLEFGYPVRIRVKPPRTASPIDLILPFDPQPDDWNVVPTNGGAGGGLLSVTMPNGASTASSTDSVRLYDGCTYTLTYHLDPHHNDAIFLAPTDGGLDPAAGSPFGSGINPGATVEQRVHASGVGGDGAHDWTGNGVATVPSPGYCNFVANLFHSAYLDAASGGTVLTIGAVYVSGPDPRFDPALTGLVRDPVEPWYGEKVQGETPAGTVNGSNTSFQTNYAYAPNSLHVEVNGADVTAGIVQTDPTTGTFAFVTAPLTGSEIHVWYQAGPEGLTGATMPAVAPSTAATALSQITGTGLTIKDEGSPLATFATSIDFVGANVVASGATGAKTVTVSGAPTGSAGGDLSGTYPNPAVVKINGSPLGSLSPALADRLRWNGSAWINSALIWQPLTDPGVPDLIYDAGDVIMVEA